MATVSDLKNWYDMHSHCKVGYCCEQNAETPKYKMIILGTNSGIYGWNWTAYTDGNTLYVSCYRNVPNCIKEK